MAFSVRSFARDQSFARAGTTQGQGCRTGQQTIWYTTKESSGSGDVKAELLGLIRLFEFWRCYMDDPHL